MYHWDIIIVITCSSILVTSGHASTLDIVFHVNACYTRHYSSIYIYHCYIYIDTPDTIISCLWTIDIQMYCFTGYHNSNICTITTWIIRTQLYHVYTPLLHRFTSIHALILCIPIARITVYITWTIAIWKFLYSRHMSVSCYWYWYFRYWTCELLICDVWN